MFLHYALPCNFIVSSKKRNFYNDMQHTKKSQSKTPISIETSMSEFMICLDDFREHLGKQRMLLLLIYWNFFFKYFLDMYCFSLYAPETDRFQSRIVVVSCNRFLLLHIRELLEINVEMPWSEHVMLFWKSRENFNCICTFFDGHDTIANYSTTGFTKFHQNVSVIYYK